INAISPSPACYCLRAQSILHWASLCLSPHLFHPTLREKVKLFVSGYVCRERQRESESVCVCVCVCVCLIPGLCVCRLVWDDCVMGSCGTAPLDHTTHRSVRVQTEEAADAEEHTHNTTHSGGFL